MGSQSLKIWPLLLAGGSSEVVGVMQLSIRHAVFGWSMVGLGILLFAESLYLWNRARRPPS